MEDEKVKPSVLTEPVHDPSLLTTAQIQRFVSAERDYTNAEFDVLRERLRGIDKANQVLNETVTRVPTDVQTASDRIIELTGVKFENIANQLQALSERTVEQKADVKAAVDAALQAAKEAVAQQTEASERSITKSEVATAKQIDSLGQLLSTNTGSLEDKLNDLKGRLDRLEASRVGGTDAVQQLRDNASSQRAWVAFGMTAILFLITVIGFAITYTIKK